MIISIKRYATLLLIAATLLLSGCPTSMYQATSNNIASLQNQIAVAKKQNAVTPDVVNNSGIYVNPTPVPFTTAPSWINTPITVHGAVLPFDFYGNRISDATGATISYATGVPRTMPISMNYSGTVKGVLDRLASKTGYAYTIQGNNILWSNMITRTFDVSFMPGSSQYSIGSQNQNSSMSNNNGGAVYFGDDTSGNQYSSMGGNLSVWNDLTNTLNSLKSKNGKVVVSQATTTVTVYDHPQNVAMMANYINYLNRDLSHQVALQVKVLEIDLNQNFNYGINWQLVYNYMGAQFGIGGNFSSLVNPGGTAGTQSAAVPTGFTFADTGHRFDGTQILINALKQQGNVSIGTENRVVTMNNQVAQIGVNTLTGYLESVSTTFTGTVGTPTTALTPGVVKTGFSLYILPKIQGNNVYLQITSDMSDLLNIQQICGAGSCPSTSNTTTAANGVISGAAIQVPTITEKTFNQRSLVPSGYTLVIAGFKQLRNEANNDKMFGVPQAQAASNSNIETIILITPTILS